MTKFKEIFIIFLLSNVLFAQNQYADSVIYAMLGGPNNIYTNLDAILGAPGGSNDVVALGGGFIVLDMGIYIVNGNGADLKVYEIGNSYPGLTTEPFYLLGNTNNSISGWKYLGKYPGDICEIDFDTLNVNNIRYIAIFDSRPEMATNTYIAPGADIDAVEALNYQMTLIEEQPHSQVNDFRLFQNYPNPFNLVTNIEFNLEKSGNVVIDVFSINGEKIKNLLTSRKTPGKYKISWDGTNEKGEQVSSGLYYYQVRVNDNVETKRMILLK